ncbi:MAG: PD-(D/E)XK nuclease family protein [Chloroflexota bacterium]|nr:PD-(D/E)XK nuclease family protein [Chloroflexota bacterium]
MLDSEMKQGEQLLQGYADQLKVIQQQYQKLPPTQPRPDTIPAIFNRAYDENFISDYLAYVLNPDKNGLGTEPLRALLGLVSAEFNGIDIQEADIYREYTLDSGRIDLLIIIDEALVVGIENKILSSESDNQTEYYAKVIRRDFTEYQKALIFLSPHGTQPSSKYFRAVSYRQLLDSFRRMPYDWITDVKKSVLWEDFLQHLEEYIVSEKTSFEFSSRAELYLENIDMLEDLQQAFKSDWDALIKHLDEKLLSHLGPNEWEIDSSQWRYYWNRVYKKSWKQEDIFASFSYFVSPKRYQASNFDLRLHVEWKYYKDFIDLYQKQMSSLQSLYDKLGIVFLPTDREPWTRDHCLAYQVIEVDPTRQNLEDKWITAIDEVNPIVQVVDETLAELASTIMETS